MNITSKKPLTDGPLSLGYKLMDITLRTKICAQRAWKFKTEATEASLKQLLRLD